MFFRTKTNDCWICWICNFYLVTGLHTNGFLIFRLSSLCRLTPSWSSYIENLVLSISSIQCLYSRLKVLKLLLSITASGIEFQSRCFLHKLVLILSIDFVYLSCGLAKFHNSIPLAAAASYPVYILECFNHASKSELSLLLSSKFAESKWLKKNKINCACNFSALESLRWITSEKFWACNFSRAFVPASSWLDYCRDLIIFYPVQSIASDWSI